MTERPYTDEDLRVEAAYQHALSVEDPDFMGIGERMDGRFIDSTVVDPDPATGAEPVTGKTWEQLDPDDFGAAQRGIDDLLGKAADLSAWAIEMGADRLEPTDDCLSLKGDDKAIARVHFAFDPGMPDDVRQSFVNGVAEVIAEGL